MVANVRLILGDEPEIGGRFVRPAPRNSQHSRICANDSTPLPD